MSQIGSFPPILGMKIYRKISKTMTQVMVMSWGHWDFHENGMKRKLSSPRIVDPERLGFLSKGKEWRKSSNFQPAFFRGYVGWKLE